jgi:hypothetical protein
MLIELYDLIDRWRSEIALYRRRGRAGDADHLESFVDELEAVLVGIYSTTAPLAEAAERVGYSGVHIQRLVKDGTVRLVETREGTEVCLCDLPVHAGRLLSLLGARLPERPADGPIELREARLRRRRDARRKLV